MGHFAPIPARNSSIRRHFSVGNGHLDSIDGTAGLSVVALETLRFNHHDRDPRSHGHRDSMAMDAWFKGLSTRQARAVS